MKIVIPTDNKKGPEDTVAEHFGRCLTYTFLNEKGEVLEIIDNTSEHMGGEGLPPELMKKRGADILLCKDLGPRALALCNELGIDVYVHQAAERSEGWRRTNVLRPETVKEIFEMWKNNKIKKAGAEDVCEQHKI